MPWLPPSQPRFESEWMFVSQVFPQTRGRRRSRSPKQTIGFEVCIWIKLVISVGLPAEFFIHQNNRLACNDAETELPEIALRRLIGRFHIDKNRAICPNSGLEIRRRCGPFELSGTDPFPGNEFHSCNGASLRRFGFCVEANPRFVVGNLHQLGLLDDLHVWQRFWRPLNEFVFNSCELRNGSEESNAAIVLR